MRRAIALARRAPGVRPARPSASGPVGPSRSRTPRPGKKAGDRGGLRRGGGGGGGAVVPGRGRSLSSHSPAGTDLASGGPSHPPAPRVRARRNGQAADAVSPSDRRSAGPGGAFGPQHGVAPLAQRPTQPGARRAGSRAASGARPLAGRPSAGRHLGALVVVL